MKQIMKTTYGIAALAVLFAFSSLKSLLRIKKICTNLIRGMKFWQNETEKEWADDIYPI